MAVSGVVSCLALRSRVWCRTAESRVLPAVRPAASSQQRRGEGGSGSGDLLAVVVGAERLVGHGGPQEAGELASDGGVGDGGGLVVLGEGAVAVVEADLGAPGAGRGGGGEGGRWGGV